MTNSYPENVDGDFDVERDCCTLCEVPMIEAPALFTYAIGNDGQPDHCYVSKQPTNDSELDSMISAIQCAEFRCIRYRGIDRRLLARLVTLGESEICDNQTRNTPYMKIWAFGTQAILSALAIFNIFRQTCFSKRPRH